MRNLLPVWCAFATLFIACKETGQPTGTGGNAGADVGAGGMTSSGGGKGGASSSSSSSSSSSNSGSGGMGGAGGGVSSSGMGGAGGSAGMGGAGMGGGGMGGGGMGGSAGMGGSGGMGGTGGMGPGVLSKPSYDAVMVFPNHPVVNTPMGIAWDGTNFWVGGNGTVGGFTEVRYNGMGQYVASYQPGIGFSSIYTKGDGTGPVFARALTWLVVERQNAPGQWSSPYTLAGPNPPTTTAVVWDANNNEHIALMDGILHRWDSTGQALPNIPFQDFGTMNNEGAYPAGRRVAWANGYYLTYSKQYISAWNNAGIRVASAKLNGAGVTDFDSAWSFSFAQGKAWVVDSSQGSWRGYVIAP